MKNDFMVCRWDFYCNSHFLGQTSLCTSRVFWNSFGDSLNQQVPILTQSDSQETNTSAIVKRLNGFKVTEDTTSIFQRNEIWLWSYSYIRLSKFCFLQRWSNFWIWSWANQKSNEFLEVATRKCHWCSTSYQPPSRILFLGQSNIW